MDLQKILQIVKESDAIFFDDSRRASVQKKGEADYVTQCDIAISEYLQKRLREEFPSIGFISEEGETAFSPKKDYWILDPIDGTTNFMHGMRLSAVSLGLWSNGEIRAGVIYNPQADEMFYATKGGGAFLNGEVIHCSTHSRLCDCIGIFEYNPYYKEEVDAAMEHARLLYQNCQDIRTLGSAAVELAYIACGRADVFFGRHLKPWDFAAAAVIISEAGGKISGIDGAFDMGKQRQHIIATNGRVHNEILTLTGEIK